MSKFQDLIEKAMRGEPLDEVAPPGDKYERMVKHIKGKNPSKKEKEIAYATAWKHYNKSNESVGGPEYERVLRMARMYLDTGMSSEGVRLEAEQQERAGFEGAARFGLAVAHAMDEIENPNESKGGGHTTQVPLRDEMGAAGEGEVATQAYSSYDHELVNDPERVGEETGTNITRSGPGTGTPHSPWVATDALPISNTYDMDITKLPEAFDFNLNEVDTLASEKGIKRVKQDGDLGGKDVKFSPEPEGRKRPDYKELGAKDVSSADNLSDEAVNKEMENSAYENVRIDHATKGRGTVIEVTDKHLVVEWDRTVLRILGPERLPLSETKYIIRIKERYTADPEEIDVEAEEPKGNKKMAKAKAKAKKQKVDEAMMAEIKSTMRDTGDGYKLPVIDLRPEDIGLISEIEVPDPGDSVLTGQDQQSSPQVAPLSTERGADAAHDSIYPDGDFAKVLVPGDAPGTPDYEQMGDEAGNPRATDGTDNPAADVSGSSGKSSGNPFGKSKDTGSSSAKDSDKDTDDSSDYKKKWGGSDNDSEEKDSDDSDDSDDDEKKDEDNDMKEGKLTWKDIGLDVEEIISEMSDTYADGTCEGCGMEESHDTAGGEVAFTKDMLIQLMSAVRDQGPDDSKLEAMCGALEEVSREKGQTLDVADIGTVMDKFKGGGAPEADAAPPMSDDGMEDPNSVGGPDAYEDEGEEEEDNKAGDVRRRGHGSGGDDDAGVRDDEYGDEAEDDNDDDEDRKYQEQDRAEGDGEEAGPEGGDEHEGKTKIMDKRGREKDDEWGKARKDDRFAKQRRKDRKDKSGRKYSSMETKGGKSIKPVSSNTSKGKGPGGGNATNDGQGMLIPAMDKGNQRGTPGTPLSKEGGGRTVKPVSESMVAIGMSGIGHTVRDVEAHSREDDDGLTEDQKELQMIRRRAGLEDWWKV